MSKDLGRFVAFGDWSEIPGSSRGDGVALLLEIVNDGGNGLMQDQVEREAQENKSVLFSQRYISQGRPVRALCDA